jgi:predicted transcriptional regulator YdeE
MSERQEERPVECLEGSEELVGYRTKIWRKDAFQITGYTLIIPANADRQTIPQFVSELMADGSIEELTKASSVPPWGLGLGSWDPECEPGGMRYTVCIEETEHTDLRHLTTKHPLHTQRFEACDWMCFEMNDNDDQFWKSNPYTMLKKLGYRFHLRVGVHFDAFPPDFDPEKNMEVEFWISVAKESEECDTCSVREDCARIQPFE